MGSVASSQSQLKIGLASLNKTARRPVPDASFLFPTKVRRIQPPFGQRKDNFGKVGGEFGIRYSER
jgi:hypothetical protein